MRTQRGSFLKRWGDPRLSLGIRLAAGWCPFCGRSDWQGYAASPAPIYRSSARAVTFRCRTCTVQWTVTIHRLVAAMRHAVEHDQKDASLLSTLLADGLGEWAETLDDRRGRPRL
jgi:hypothetical protein